MPIWKCTVVLAHPIPNAQTLSIKQRSEFFNLLRIHPLSALVEVNGERKEVEATTIENKKKKKKKEKKKRKKTCVYRAHRRFFFSFSLSLEQSGAKVKAKAIAVTSL